MARWKCTRTNKCIKKCSTTWPTEPDYCFYNDKLEEVQWQKIAEKKKTAIAKK